MKELTSRFGQARRALLGTLEGLSADQAAELAFGKWDLRCVLAHLAGWDRYFTEIVKLLRAGSAVPYWGDIDRFNEGSVAQCEAWTWEQVYDEFVQAGQAFIECYDRLDKALWNRPFWVQGTQTPLWIVEINIEHYETHLAKIEQRLKEWGEGQVQGAPNQGTPT